MLIFGGHYRVPGGLDQARLFPLRISVVLCQDSFSLLYMAPPTQGPSSQVGSPLHHFPWIARSGGRNPPSLSRPSRSAKPTTMYVAHPNFPKYHLSLRLKSLGRLPAPVGELSNLPSRPARPPAGVFCSPSASITGTVSSHLSPLLLLLMG